jgi:hypothetical protein
MGEASDRNGRALEEEKPWRCFLEGGGGGGDGDRLLFFVALCSLQVRWVGFVDGGISMDQ